MRKNSVSILGLVLLAVAGVLFLNQPSQTQPQPAKNIVKWEYKFASTVDLLKEKGKEEDIVKAALKGLNKLGDEGWELVCQDGNGYWFKRQK